MKMRRRRSLWPCRGVIILFRPVLAYTQRDFARLLRVARIITPIPSIRIQVHDLSEQERADRMSPRVTITLEHDK